VELREARRRIAEFEREAARSNAEEMKVLKETLEQLKTEADTMEQQLAAYGDRIAKAAQIAENLHRILSEPEIEKVVRTYVAPRPMATPKTQRKVPAVPTGSGEYISLRKGAREMLAVLCQWSPSGRSEAQVAAQVQMKRTGGTFGAYKSDLKNGGYMEIRDGLWFATQRGIDYFGGEVPDMPATTQEVVQLWAGKLRKGAREMLNVLVSHRGRAVSREDLGAAVGMEASGGTFGAYLTDLKQAGLIAVDREGVAANRETLFL
jgi:hypothetical protein